MPPLSTRLGDDAERPLPRPRRLWNGGAEEVPPGSWGRSREDFATSHFFDQPHAAAVFKHAALRRYLRAFASKLAARAPDHKVAYLDGYAGLGEYQDGSPGSPAIALDTAESILKIGGSIEGHLVEREATTCQQLQDLIAKRRPDWHVYCGDVVDFLDQILGRIDRLPLFAFLDPFGLGMPFDLIQTRLLSRGGHMDQGVRRGGTPTEVLLNFSWSGLRRTGGQAMSTSTDPIYAKAQPKFLKKVDEALGGPWWQEIWRSHRNQRVELITAGFLNRLRGAAGGWQVLEVPVTDRWGGPTRYYLILITQHPHGLWLFNDVLSSAREDFRKFWLQQVGQFDLEQLSDREPQWVSLIKDNLCQLLDQYDRGYKVGDFIRRVYGETLTFARGKHVRRAIEDLRKEGRATWSEEKEYVDRVVTRLTGPATPPRSEQLKLF